MQTQNASPIMPGTYVFKSRASAAGLARKMCQAQRQAGKAGHSKLSVAWQIVKSGLTRQVAIPATTSVAQLNAMREVATDLENLVHKKLCTRKPGAFDLPSGFSWRQGNAKNLSRHIVVRHWTTPGKQDSSIHTALSMKDQLTGVNDYATWTPIKIRLTDWSVASNPVKRLLAPLKRKIDDLTHRDFPVSPLTYREDKSLYLNPGTKYKLQDGQSAREQLDELAQHSKKPSLPEHQTLRDDDTTLVRSAALVSSDEAQRAKADTEKEELKLTDQLLKQAAFRPMPFQKVSSKSASEWQRKAEKHYLPCIGHDQHRHSDQGRFVMFGLNLSKMRKSWQDVRNQDHPRHFYQKLSREQNCSGMCLSLLKAGGADHFYTISPKLVTSQADMEKYSATLMNQLDDLNDRANWIDRQVRFFEVPEQPQMTLDTICQRLESINERYTMPARWKAEIRQLTHHIREFEKTNATLDELIPVAARLTTSFHRTLLTTERHPYIQDRLEPAFHAFQLLKNSMIAAFDKEEKELNDKRSDAH